jgi:lactoylglutathione lyase
MDCSAFAAALEPVMRYLHTMVRIKNIDASLDFYCQKLGMVEIRRYENPQGRFTLIFLAASHDKDRAKTDSSSVVELTYNWDVEDYGEGRNFGHLAYEVDDIYGLCDQLMKSGVTINRPPRDGRMAFVRSPDNISIELLQKGEALPLAEPWKSMPNTGKW